MPAAGPACRAEEGGVLCLAPGERIKFPAIKTARAKVLDAKCGGSLGKAQWAQRSCGLPETWQGQLTGSFISNLRAMKTEKDFTQ